MPCSTEQLLPKTVNQGIVQKKFEEKKTQQKKYYDRSSKPLEPLSTGDDVYVQIEGRWKLGVITNKADTPRSFNIMTEDGTQYRRNRVHLRKAYLRASQLLSPEENPPEEEDKVNSPSVNEQIQHQDTREENEQTSLTNETETSLLKTRSGRIVRKPVLYRDCT